MTNVIGSNPHDCITYEDVIGSQLKSKFIEQITKAISVVMRKHKVSFGDIGMYGSDISDELNQVLDESWKRQYGLVVTDVAIADINLTDESMKRVNKIDDARIFSDKSLQSGLMASSVSEAMVNASKNDSGAMMGFASMNMAGNVGANVLNSVNSADSKETEVEENMPEPGTLFQKEETSINEEKSKFCSACGAKASGKFCSECGEPIK